MLREHPGNPPVCARRHLLDFKELRQSNELLRNAYHIDKTQCGAESQVVSREWGVGV